MEIRVGNGFDIHRFTSNKNLILGNVIIKYKKGLLAHSDGDVLIHSIIDSFLGAANLGDIGTFFPDNDPKYKNIDSRILLEKIIVILKENLWEIINLDSTIICEKPKLNKHIPKIKQKLSEIIGINVERISIKAKTREKLDSIGKCKAIEVYTVALLKKKVFDNEETN
jgi:2-C-methyl-D-erythritol 2,4-cyclodiphosphate synthase